MQLKEWPKRPKTLVGFACGQKTLVGSLSQSPSEPSPRIYPCVGSRLTTFEPGTFRVNKEERRAVLLLPHGGLKIGGGSVFGMFLNAPPLNEEAVAQAAKHAHDPQTRSDFLSRRSTNKPEHHTRLQTNVRVARWLVQLAKHDECGSRRKSERKLYGHIFRMHRSVLSADDEWRLGPGLRSYRLGKILGAHHSEESEKRRFRFSENNGA